MGNAGKPKLSVCPPSSLIRKEHSSYICSQPSLPMVVILGMFAAAFNDVQPKYMTEQPRIPMDARFGISAAAVNDVQLPYIA